MTLEKLAEQIFKEFERDGEPVTKEESLEMARMELGAKEIKNYAQAEKPRKKSTKERKVDTEKLAILTMLAETLTENGYNAQIEKEIAIHFGNYSLKLTRHRPPKQVVCAKFANLLVKFVRLHKVAVWRIFLNLGVDIFILMW